ncbi:MAG TPA: class I SAM-dependent rRNA methyltransferase [Bacteroidales bacterium]|jgi:23S rRNA (cytosine1962-C5)-methyltransferase|nr:class I SAM-dependent rRNA methyltransferase [Bacteroidales bacterium]
MYPVIRLKKNKEASLKRFHPWVFSGAIESLPKEIKEGDLVDVVDCHGEWLARGHYQPDSISVRVLTFTPKEINVAFFQEKIKWAVELRKSIGLWNNNETNVFRLIHGEGDGMPGLIADYYNGLLVLQFHSAGMYLQRNNLVQALLNEIPDIKAIYNKSQATLPPKFEQYPGDGFLFGTCENPILISENNLHFKINFIEGQKTGFFIDQRENRQLLSKFCQGKKVANLFGYTGGFSIYAAKNGATKVITVDSSVKALETAQENYSLNHCTQIENIASDVTDYFKSIQQEWDIVVLDPPAFAKHHKHREKALVAYKNLNAKGMRMLNKGGLLFTYSCSQAISAADLRQAIFVAAASENRHASILYQLHQPGDHPISLFHPEGEYLKGFVVKVI